MEGLGLSQFPRVGVGFCQIILVLCMQEGWDLMQHHPLKLVHVGCMEGLGPSQYPAKIHSTEVSMYDEKVGRHKSLPSLRMLAIWPGSMEILRSSQFPRSQASSLHINFDRHFFGHRGLISTAQRSWGKPMEVSFVAACAIKFCAAIDQQIGFGSHPFVNLQSFVIAQ